MLDVIKTEASSAPKFAVDVDSTLYSFETVARESFRQLYEETKDESYLRGQYHSWDEWRSPADVCGIDTWMDVIKRCHAPEVVAAQTPFPGAVETLQMLEDAGYGIMYVSTRSPHSANATSLWLLEEGFPFGEHTEVHCQMEDKAPFIAECQYLIDDRPKTMLDFVYDSTWDKAKGERKALSLMYAYNRALTDIPNIFLSPTWGGLQSWLKRKGFFDGNN